MDTSLKRFRVKPAELARRAREHYVKKDAAEEQPKEPVRENPFRRIMRKLDEANACKPNN
jgi:hypothetical protein